MTQEQILLLELMKLSIKGQQLHQLPQENINWASLWKEARAQTVPVLCFHALSPIQQNIYAAFPELEEQMQLSYIHLGQTAQLEAAQADISAILDQLKCPYLILKGTTSASYYPDPSLRILGDIDVLIPSDQVDRVTGAMVALGYRELEKELDHHTALAKNGAVLELHTAVAGIPRKQGKKAVLDYLQTLHTHKQQLSTAAGSYYAPSAHHHALVMVLHMVYHIEEYGFGLRHLMDWACFLEKTAQDEFWQELLSLLRKIGLFRFTAVVTRLCSLYLGSPCPDWAADISQELCQAMIEDVMTGGNFGRKDPDRARSATMLPDWESQPKAGKICRMFQVLRYYILLEKPELEHKPVALFFRMAGSCVRFIFLSLQGKRPDLIRAAIIAEERKSVYEQLQLYKVSN